MKKYFWSMLDGSLQSLIFVLLIEVIVSPYWNDFGFFEILFFVLLVILSVISSLLFINKCEQCVVRCSLISFVFFIFTLVLSFINNIEWKIRLIPRRELGNADGIIIMFFASIYLIILFVEKLAVLIFMVIKEHKKTEHKGDGSSVFDDDQSGDGSLIDDSTN